MTVYQKLYNEVMKTIDEAYMDLNTFTDNQQGMAAHYRSVAAEFARASMLLKKLEDYAIQAADDWDGYNSNNSVS